MNIVWREDLWQPIVLSQEVLQKLQRKIEEDTKKSKPPHVYCGYQDPRTCYELPGISSYDPLGSLPPLLDDENDGLGGFWNTHKKLPGLRGVFSLLYV